MPSVQTEEPTINISLLHHASWSPRPRVSFKDFNPCDVAKVMIIHRIILPNFVAY
jgi:hypothetical protein